MKILVVCQYYYPENFQITPICEQLVSDGYEVTVLTGLPNYPSGIVPDEYKSGHRDEIINGVHVVRCYEIGRKKGAVHLALNYLSFWNSALSKVKKLPSDFDIVFVYQLSPVMMGLPGRKYAKKHNVPLFLYCCDLWPESLKMYIKNEDGFVFKYFKRVSNKVYSACDKIACQSSSFLSYLSNVHNIAQDRLTYLPAFADEKYLMADFTPENDVVDFVFLGNLGIAQNLISVLQAVKLIRDVPGFHVHFVGDGACLNEMKDFVQKNGMTNVVSFYGRRPVEEMTKFYKLADACIVSLKANNQVGLTLPGKVQGYMAAGKPIIAMIEGSAKKVIEDSGCGICIDSDDIDGFAMAMKDFVENRDKYKDCGTKARQYFKEHFRKEVMISNLEKEFNSLKGEKTHVNV